MGMGGGMGMGMGVANASKFNSRASRRASMSIWKFLYRVLDLMHCGSSFPQSARGFATPPLMGSIEFGSHGRRRCAFHVGRGSYQLDGSTVLALLHALTELCPPELQSTEHMN